MLAPPQTSLSSVNTYTSWPGGIDPTVRLYRTTGGRRRRTARDSRRRATRRRTTRRHRRA